MDESSFIIDDLFLSRELYDRISFFFFFLLNIEDDSTEYYCNVCEIKRDPQFSVYYYEKCKYIAHVHNV